MNFLARLSATTLFAGFLASCGTSRSAFTPDDAPVTVGMPAQLSERERSYVSEVDSALRSQGYQPVRHGAGELRLEFEIAEGPINIDTTLELLEGRTVQAKGFGRGSGVPMVGRDKVAERSFRRAFEEFQSALPNASSVRSHAPGESGNERDGEYVY